MPYIELTRGKQAFVDDADFEALSAFKWSVHRDSQSKAHWRAYRHIPKSGSKSIEMSRELMGIREGHVIDHRNRDTLDYRRSNLRWATHQQNSQNRVRKNRIHPGVTKNGSGFTARISVGKGPKLNLGTFKSVGDAIRTYIAACNNHFGDFSPYSNAV